MGDATKKKKDRTRNRLNGREAKLLGGIRGNTGVKGAKWSRIRDERSEKTRLKELLPVKGGGGGGGRGYAILMASQRRRYESRARGGGGEGTTQKAQSRLSRISSKVEHGGRETSARNRSAAGTTKAVWGQNGPWSERGGGATAEAALAI